MQPTDEQVEIVARAQFEWLNGSLLTWESAGATSRELYRGMVRRVIRAWEDVRRPAYFPPMSGTAVHEDC